MNQTIVPKVVEPTNEKTKVQRRLILCMFSFSDIILEPNSHNILDRMQLINNMAVIMAVET